jgi:hypothetical protein
MLLWLSFPLAASIRRGHSVHSPFPRASALHRRVLSGASAPRSRIRVLAISGRARLLRACNSARALRAHRQRGSHATARADGHSSGRAPQRSGPSGRNLTIDQQPHSRGRPGRQRSRISCAGDRPRLRSVSFRRGPGGKRAVSSARRMRARARMDSVIATDPSRAYKAP